MAGRQRLMEWVVGAAVVALVAGGPSPVRAGDDEAGVSQLGKAIVEAAHPSGVKHKLSDYSSRGNILTIEMYWRGAVLDTPYTSKIKVVFKTVDGKARIESIDYQDDAFITYSRPNIDRLIRDHNGD